MRYYFSIAIVVSLLMASCAQVGTISGGERDLFAPVPNMEKASPTNQSVNFSAKKVIIPFNEFFALNNPAQSVMMVPPHASVKTTFKGKNLILEWEEDLHLNTTYSIFLDGTVKDISEGNDSVIQYVFSTGPAIDTLSYSAFVADAWTKSALDGITLGLFDLNDSSLINFARSDASGKVCLNYLREGNYRLIAFEDANTNLLVDPNERIGFKDDATVEIQGTNTDSIPIQLFYPDKEQRLKSVQFKSPGTVILSSNKSLLSADFFWNDVQIDTTRLRYITSDSVHLFVDAKALTGGQTVRVKTAHGEMEKTLRLPINNLSRSLVIKSVNINNNVAPSEDLIFEINDFITAIDTQHIHLFNSQDSTEIIGFGVKYAYNRFSIQLDKSELEGVLVEIDSARITGLNMSSVPFSTVLNLLPKRKYGSLSVNISEYAEPIVLELLSDSKIIAVREILDTKEPVLFDELEPGTYSFRVIRDENQNGRWDVGNFNDLKQPERVDRYSEPQKVRANWQVDVTLTPME